jgi:apolipoprotein N-acyltransferase
VQAPFAVKDQLVLPNVCYEDVFGEEIAQQLRDAPRPATHAAERVEPGVVRRVDRDPAAPADLAHAHAGDRPPDAARDQRRRHRRHRRPRQRPQVLPFYSQGVLTATVQGMAGSTPYIRFGNLACSSAWAR